MNYDEAVAYIHQTPKFSKILGNKNLSKLLHILGNPHKKLKFIHIGGTNGKGSVAAMTANILIHAGYKTGMFISPYIERFNERISINGECISDSELAVLTTKIRNCMEENQIFVSEFALELIIAFLHYIHHQCDIVILEVGLGGRLDATNVIENSLVTVLTSIGRDHMQYLGNSIEEITREKCGIIKNGGMVVVSPKQEAVVLQEISSVCKKQNAKMYIADLVNGERFQLGLKGSFQKVNAAAVIKTCELLITQGFSIAKKNIEAGLLTVKWPGRFERIGSRIILDGAHNLPAAKALVSELKKLNKKIHLVTTIMQDKEMKEMVRVFATVADKVTVTEIDMPRCCPADELKALFQENQCNPLVVKPAVQAVQKAMEDDADIICVCGSLYLIGEIRQYFLHKEPKRWR